MHRAHFIFTAMDEKTALNMARRLCSRREYSSFQIRERLISEGIDDRQAGQILRTLKEEQFLDDARYLRSFIHDKWRFGRWGRMKIFHALRLQGFSAEDVQSAWAEVDADAYAAMVQAELEKKFRALKQTPSYEVRQKLLRFGAGRGYDVAQMAGILDDIVR